MISTALFTQNIPNKTLSAFLSDLKEHFTNPPTMLTLESDKTGAISSWERHRTVTDREGEIQSILYRATAEQVSRVPLHAQWTIQLFND